MNRVESFQERSVSRTSTLEPFLAFLRLGCTSFGGPVAHLGYFQNEFVQRRKWIGDEAFANVVALCQFLPGPASSQVAFVIGYLRSGLLGGLLGWMAFTAPSAVLMIGFAYGVEALHVATAGWLLGLKVAAVAVVAQAIWTMLPKLCPDLIRVALTATVAAALIFFHATWMQPVAIAAGALVGWTALRSKVKIISKRETFTRAGLLSPRLAAVVLAIFAVLFAVCLVWRRGDPLADTFARFYRTGSLVFGGGHVVLPLLEQETVSSGLVSHDTFLSGYGAAQALPGPLFTFAAFLGASMHSPFPPWLLGLWCLGAILLPSLLLVVGVLPFWARLTTNIHAQAALKGANAAVVGLLVAAFYNPVWTSGVTSWPAGVMAVAGFLALQFGKVPNWAVVAICALAGACLL